MSFGEEGIWLVECPLGLKYIIMIYMKLMWRVRTTGAIVHVKVYSYRRVTASVILNLDNKQR
jgi:hypothetical protein